MQDFPYALEDGIEHHNIWASRPLTAEQLRAEVEARRRGYESLHFVNPTALMSVPGVSRARCVRRPRGCFCQRMTAVFLGRRSGTRTSYRGERQTAERSRCGGAATALDWTSRHAAKPRAGDGRCFFPQTNPAAVSSCCCCCRCSVVGPSLGFGAPLHRGLRCRYSWPEAREGYTYTCPIHS